MADFKVAQRPGFKISDVDLQWVIGTAHGGEFLLEDGSGDLLLEDGDNYLFDDFDAKSYVFKVAQRPSFRVDDDDR